MKAIQAIVLAILLPLPILVSAQKNGDTVDMNKIKALPRDVEIELARSALPPYLRDSATVYILNPDKGFEVVQKGTNGFHAFVARTGDDAMRGNWVLKNYRDDILYPISFDAAGAKAQMRVFFDIAAMQAQGMQAETVKQIIQARYKTNYYQPPQRAGVSYMLEPILVSYTNPDSNENVIPQSIPHVMYYAPNVTNKEIGGGKPGGPYPFVILHGEHGYTIQFLGVTEQAEIRKDYADLLAKLCAINPAWCLPASSPKTPMEHHH